MAARILLKTYPLSTLVCGTVRPYSLDMGDHVHATAREGFQSGSFYDQNRPSYTDEIVNHVISRLYLGPSEGLRYKILELGAGTGKFSRQIFSRLDKDVTYLATEPSEGFLTTLQKQSPGLETMACSAIDIPLPDNSVQNIVCAQCFHWFADHESLREIYRVLSPQGRFLCVWNRKDLETNAWCIGMENILSKYYTADTPRFVSGQWRKAINTFPQLSSVEDCQMKGITGMQGDKNYIISHFSSISVIAELGDEEKQTAQNQFRNVLDQHFNDDETIQIPFVSHFYCAEKV